jgi:hypothetical protein
MIRDTAYAISRARRKPPALLLSLAFLTISQASCAADWWMLPLDGKSDGEKIAYVDKSSLQRQKGGRRAGAWIWTQYRDDQNAAEGSYRGLKQHLLVDCAQKTAGADAETRLSAYGETVSRVNRPDPALAPVPPDSALETISGFICTGGKQPFKSIPVYDPGKDAEQRFWLKEREKK